MIPVRVFLKEKELVELGEIHLHEPEIKRSYCLEIAVFKRQRLCIADMAGAIGMPTVSRVLLAWDQLVEVKSRTSRLITDILTVKEYDAHHLAFIGNFKPKPAYARLFPEAIIEALELLR